MGKKALKYERIYLQLQELFVEKRSNPVSRMASIVALLHHKMKTYYWTGFYLLDEHSELMVTAYQGPLACMHLKKDRGVCWAAINAEKTQVVDDVEAFPGHIACSSLTQSEIVVPLFDAQGTVYGCLDVDSRELANFDEEDRMGLEKIVGLIG